MSASLPPNTRTTSYTGTLRFDNQLFNETLSEYIPQSLRPIRVYDRRVLDLQINVLDRDHNDTLFQKYRMILKKAHENNSSGSHSLYTDIILTDAFQVDLCANPSLHFGAYLDGNLAGEYSFVPTPDGDVQITGLELEPVMHPQSRSMSDLRIRFRPVITYKSIADNEQHITDEETDEEMVNDTQRPTDEETDEEMANYFADLSIKIPFIDVPAVEDVDDKNW